MSLVIKLISSLDRTGKYVKEEKSGLQKKQQLMQKQERINKELRRIDGPVSFCHSSITLVVFCNLSG